MIPLVSPEVPFLTSVLNVSSLNLDFHYPVWVTTKPLPCSLYEGHQGQDVNWGISLSASG